MYCVQHIVVEYIMSSGEDKIRAKIKELEFEYARTQKNKATEFHIGILKAKISKVLLLIKIHFH